jgi:RNA polymerase sigma-B factor
VESLSRRTSSKSIDESLERLALTAESARDPGARAEAYEQMICSALPLADSLARRYAGRGIDVDDLVQVARMAVVKAVRRYRPGEGHRFTVYIVPSVTGELKRCFRDQGWWIRPPRRLQELHAQILVQEERLRHALLRNPDDDEIAAAVGCRPVDVGLARVCIGGYHPVSLDATTESGRSHMDGICGAVPSTEGAIALRDALGRAMLDLTDRQRLVLRLRFVEELSQGEIAERVGVSQIQVSRILRAVLAVLREYLNDGETRARESESTSA